MKLLRSLISCAPTLFLKKWVFEKYELQDELTFDDGLRVLRRQRDRGVRAGSLPLGLGLGPHRHRPSRSRSAARSTGPAGSAWRALREDAGGPGWAEAEGADLRVVHVFRNTMLEVIDRLTTLSPRNATNLTFFC